MTVYEQEKINPYHKEGDKGELVEQMFDNIAPTYDTLNHRLSWNIDKLWRRKAIDAMRPYSPKRMLDIATGTGDFALLAARRLFPDEVVGIDLSSGMLAIGKQKAARAGLDDKVKFSREDCMSLSFADGSFDAVTAAFGIRNFQNLEQGLREMQRVLRVGGVLSIVELTQPVSFPMRQLFGFYSHTILPAYGRLISKDKGAYNYLISTIEAFPQGEVMVEILKRCGFAEASFRRLTFGICTMYFARKLS